MSTVSLENLGHRRAHARRPGPGRPGHGDHAARGPAGRLRLNSDRGTQYASAQITAFAAANGLTRSMGL